MHKRIDMEKHLYEKCRKFEIPCDYAYIGCQYSDYRNRMEMHYNNKRFRKQHVEMIQMWISNSFDME